MSDVEHKVDELQRVTDADLESLLNRRSREAWTLARIDYIKEPGVRRPQMAFLYFERSRPVEAEDDATPEGER